MSTLDGQKLLLALAFPGWQLVVNLHNPTPAISPAARDGRMSDEEAFRCGFEEDEDFNYIYFIDMLYKIWKIKVANPQFTKKARTVLSTL